MKKFLNLEARVPMTRFIGLMRNVKIDGNL